MESQMAVSQQQASLAQQVGAYLNDMVERWRERIAELVLPLINKAALQKQLDHTSLGKIARIVQQRLAKSGMQVSESQITAEINAAVSKVIPIKKKAEETDEPVEDNLSPAQRLHIKEFFEMAEMLVQKKDHKAFKQLIELAETDKILKPYHVDKLKTKAIELLS